MNSQSIRRAHNDEANHQSSRMEGMRQHIRAMYIRATLEGFDMSDHLLLMVDTSTRLGRWFGSHGKGKADEPESDELALFLASKDAFSEALGQLGMDQGADGHAALTDPVELGAMRLVCIAKDMVFLDIPVADGLA